MMDDTLSRNSRQHSRIIHYDSVTSFIRRCLKLFACESFSWNKKCCFHFVPIVRLVDDFAIQEDDPGLPQTNHWASSRYNQNNAYNYNGNNGNINNNNFYWHNSVAPVLNQLLYLDFKRDAQVASSDLCTTLIMKLIAPVLLSTYVLRSAILLNQRVVTITSFKTGVITQRKTKAL